MAKDLEELTDFLNGKDIAVVGGSPVLFDEKYDIDSHEVVIRINLGAIIPKQHQEQIGKKIDVLAVSDYLSPIGFFRDRGITFSPEKFCKKVLWLSPHTIAPASKREKCDITAFPWYFYPMEDWRILKKKLGARPTSGCMLLDFIGRKVNLKSLSLYGFDFMRQDSWYHKLAYMPHNGANEEAYIREVFDGKEITIHLPEEIKNKPYRPIKMP